MAIIVPSRSATLNVRFVQHLNSIIYPMNARRAFFWVTGAEVGDAYDSQVKEILAHPELASYKYLLTIEDDMLVPADAIIRLLEAIEAGPYDGVGALYFTKSPDFPMPMIYGDAAQFARTGVLDFRPHDPTPYLKDGGSIVECNGIAMGCSLYRLQSFRDVQGPWFQTVSDLTPQGAQGWTQDLFWCAKAKRAGKRFAVDCRVRCGHADWTQGVVY